MRHKAERHPTFLVMSTTWYCRSSIIVIRRGGLTCRRKGHSLCTSRSKRSTRAAHAAKKSEASNASLPGNPTTEETSAGIGGGDQDSFAARLLLGGQKQAVTQGVVFMTWPRFDKNVDKSPQLVSLSLHSDKIIRRSGFGIGLKLGLVFKIKYISNHLVEAGPSTKRKRPARKAGREVHSPSADVSHLVRVERGGR